MRIRRGSLDLASETPHLLPADYNIPLASESANEYHRRDALNPNGAILLSAAPVSELVPPLADSIPKKPAPFRSAASEKPTVPSKLRILAHG